MIIVSKCPYRISLLGGGSDLDWYLKRNNTGYSIGYSLDLHSYTVVQKMSNTSEFGILNYSSREYYSSIDDITHPLIHWGLKTFSQETPLNITTYGHASGGSGLGGSSSFLISLLAALATLNGQSLTPSDLAKMAADIEIDKLKKPVGRQDQYLCASGGVNAYRYNPNGTCEGVEMSQMKVDMLNEMISNFVLVPTGVTRDASAVLESIKNQDDSVNHIHEISKYAREFLYSADVSLSSMKHNFNGLVKDAWIAKKAMKDTLSSPILQDLSTIIESMPIYWHRLLGAGNGGYFLVYPKKSCCEFIEDLRSRGINSAIAAPISQESVKTFII